MLNTKRMIIKNAKSPANEKKRFLQNSIDEIFHFSFHPNNKYAIMTVSRMINPPSKEPERSGGLNVI